MKQIILLLLAVAITNAYVYQFDQNYVDRCSYLRTYKRDSQASIQAIDVTLGAGFDYTKESALCIDSVCKLFRKKALVLDLWHTQFLDGNSGCVEPLPFGASAACYDTDNQDPTTWSNEDNYYPNEFYNLLNTQTIDLSDDENPNYQYSQLSTVRNMAQKTWYDDDYDISVYSIQFVTKELVINIQDICANYLSARFILAIKNLASKIGNVEIQPSDIQNLVETFGNSVITHVKYGGRATLIKKSNYNGALDEAAFRSNEDSLIFQGGDAIAIQTTSEKYNTWRRTIKTNPNIISVKYITLKQLFSYDEIFNEYDITDANLATIRTAYNTYMSTYANDVLDVTMYWSGCGSNFDIKLGFKFCSGGLQ